SLQIAGVSPTGHMHDVARTFALSFDRLNAANPTDALALTLLARTARFAPGEPVPRDLLKATIGETQPARQVGKAIRRLVELGLVDEEADGALRMHRLVAKFVQERSRDAEAQAVVERVVLETANRLNDAGIPAPLLALQAHLRTVADAALHQEDEHAASLCNA